jgi:hypothetical protein
MNWFFGANIHNDTSCHEPGYRARGQGQLRWSDVKIFLGYTENVFRTSHLCINLSPWSEAYRFRFELGRAVSTFCSWVCLVYFKKKNFINISFEFKALNVYGYCQVLSFECMYRGFQFLAKVKATCIGKLLDSLPMYDEVVELCSG